MSNVILFNGVTKLEIPADRVLDNAPRDLEGVVIVGYDKEGELYFASSYPDGPNIVWLFELAKKALLEVEEVE